MRIASLFVLALFSGCGGAQISHDDLTRDDAALRAHQYHEDLVQLAGDVDAHPDPSVAGSCAGVCEAAPRITELADRICQVSHDDPNDEATLFLCDDSREREGSSTRRAQTCHCETEPAATTEG